MSQTPTTSNASIEGGVFSAPMRPAEKGSSPDPIALAGSRKTEFGDAVLRILRGPDAGEQRSVDLGPYAEFADADSQDLQDLQDTLGGAVPPGEPEGQQDSAGSPTIRATSEADAVDLVDDADAWLTAKEDAAVTNIDGDGTLGDVAAAPPDTGIGGLAEKHESRPLDVRAGVMAALQAIGAQAPAESTGDAVADQSEPVVDATGAARPAAPEGTSAARSQNQRGAMPSLVKQSQANEAAVERAVEHLASSVEAKAEEPVPEFGPGVRVLSLEEESQVTVQEASRLASLAGDDAEDATPATGTTVPRVTNHARNENQQPSRILVSGDVVGRPNPVSQQSADASRALQRPASAATATPEVESGPALRLTGQAAEEAPAPGAASAAILDPAVEAPPADSGPVPAQEAVTEVGVGNAFRVPRSVPRIDPAPLAHRPNVPDLPAGPGEGRSLPPRPSSVLLEVHPEGLGEPVVMRVRVFGESVSARVVRADPQVAQSLMDGRADLANSLERHGFKELHMSRSADLIAASAPHARDAAMTSPNPENSPGHERGSKNGEQPGQQQDPRRQHKPTTDDAFARNLQEAITS